jgi:peptidoglycan/xylan/chitin deacetylase (PgdA/CDA1 family)
VSHSIPVLLYHRIEDSSASTATSPRIFRQQLASLKEQGWKSLSAQEFAHTMKNGGPVRERSFLITFDDGYETVRTVALDILRDLDFKAISFLSTNLLRDTETEQQALPDGESRDAYLSWDQARELQASGIVDCQSHSHGHQNFTGYALDAIRRDLMTSIDLLAEKLNLPRNHFSHLAWPWGLSKKEWRDIASEVGLGYQYAVGKQSARISSALDQIPRTCFDATNFSQFQRQVWLQTGQLSHVWDIAYPLGRRLKSLANVARG